MSHEYNLNEITAFSVSTHWLHWHDHTFGVEKYICTLLRLRSTFWDKQLMSHMIKSLHIWDEGTESDGHREEKNHPQSL